MRDQKLTFAKAQATAPWNTGTQVFTDGIDLGMVEAKEGTTGRFKIRANVTTALVGNTATIQVKLQDSADNSSFADTPLVGATTTLSGGGTSHPAGYLLLEGPLPLSTRRYIRLVGVVATANITAGAVTAAIEWI